MTNRNAQKPFTAGNEPTHTITAGGAHQNAVTAFLSHFYSSNTNGGQGDPEQPAKAITAAGQHHAVVAAHIEQANGGPRNKRLAGRDARRPLSTAAPTGYRDWPTLAACAAQLLAQRESGDPASVAKGRMSADQAAWRLDVARALALQWQYVIGHRDAPADGWNYFETFGAFPIAGRLDLADIARNAAARANAEPGNVAKADLAGACACLSWWQMPHTAATTCP